MKARGKKRILKKEKQGNYAAGRPDDDVYLFFLSNVAGKLYCARIYRTKKLN